MEITQLLSDRERAEIERLLEVEELQSALKKVFLYGIYGSGTIKKNAPADYNRNFALGLVFDASGRELSQDNETLGRRLRSSAEGIRFLETGFAELEKFRRTPPVEEAKGNPAI